VRLGDETDALRLSDLSMDNCSLVPRESYPQSNQGILRYCYFIILLLYSFVC